jgi:hypothetical protein
LLTSSRLRHRKSERGIALLSIIALLLIFVIFAGGVVVQMAQEVNSVHNDGVSNRALVAADAGVRAAIVAIEESISKGGPLPGAVTFAYPEAIGAPSVSYSAHIGKQWDSLTGGGSRYYLIDSTGTVDNGHELQNRTVHAMIRAQSVTTFGSASNYDTNQFGSQVWYTPDQQFNGPVYDGGPMHIQYDDTSTSPIFLATVQTPNTPVWNDLQGGTSPTTPADWASIISAGSKGFDIGGNPIGLPVPQDNVLVASEAFYGDATSLTTSFPTCAAVCMNKGPAESGSGALTTGIYVSGNATISGTSVGSTETLTIKGSFPTYQVAIDFGSGKTTISKGGVKGPTYTGVPSGDNGPGAGNGAIFVNGNASLQLGTVIQGDYVLTVPDYSGNQDNIILTGSGNITYKDTTKDELGLWANDVILSTSASNVAIDASIIAGFPGESKTDGGLYNNRCNSSTCTAGNQGALTLNGALMENMRGAVGKFISQTPPVHVGFDRHINYDPRLASNPPPFYPVTGNYSIVAWDDEGQ